MEDLPILNDCEDGCGKESDDVLVVTPEGTAVMSLMENELGIRWVAAQTLKSFRTDQVPMWAPIVFQTNWHYDQLPTLTGEDGFLMSDRVLAVVDDYTGYLVLVLKQESFGPLRWIEPLSGRAISPGCVKAWRPL